MSELPILFPTPEVIQLQRRKVEIRPVALGHFELYGKSAGALIQLLAAASAEQIHAYAATHSADLARVLAATTSLNRWQARRLPVAVTVQLMVEVIRVNSGFFGQAQVAMARALAGLQSPKS